MTGFSRRQVLTALPAAGLLSACATPQGRTRPAQSLVQGIVTAPPLDRAPAAGFVILDAGGNVLASEAAGLASGIGAAEEAAAIPQRPFTTDTPFRVASVSKMAVALTAAKLVEARQFDLDADIRTWWPGFPRHPRWPDTPITPRQLLSHTSGLRDPEVYWMAHPGRIDSLISDSLFADGHQPGVYFEYCNFGYGILATAMEFATNQRFDHLATLLALLPAQMNAGFNWSGTSAGRRASGATLYIETANGWEIQADRPAILAVEDPAILIEDGASLTTYTAGQNGTLFSPQGGLRASLLDMARLAARAAEADDLTRPVWTLNAAADNGLHDQRYFTSFASGIQIHTAGESIWPGERLLGHHGEAYGLYSGAWAAPGLGISFAYAVTGTPKTPPARSADHPALNRFTAPLMRAVRAAYETSPATR